MNEQYQLFRLMPISTHRSSNEYMLFQPEFEYLAASLDRNTFYLMNQMELNACDKINYLYSCYQDAAIMTVKQKSGNGCEINIFRGMPNLHKKCRIQSTMPFPKSVKLKTTNSWFLPSIANMNSTLYAMAIPFTFSLSGEEILIQRDCIIKTDHVHIRSRGFTYHVKWIHTGRAAYFTYQYNTTWWYV